LQPLGTTPANATTTAAGPHNFWMNIARRPLTGWAREIDGY
jgi:hypothetical protein